MRFLTVRNANMLPRLPPPPPRRLMLDARVASGCAVVAAAVAAWLAYRRAPPKPLRPRFILFGDSITQQSFRVGGWGARLANTYERTADLINRGYSGYNTRWIMRLLPRIFPTSGEAPSLVTVCLGANDAVRPPPIPGTPLTDDSGRPLAGRQHVPLEEYRANLVEIVACARRCGGGGARVLLITPPPVDEGDWLRHVNAMCGRPVPADAEPDRRAAITAEYARVCVEVGQSTHTPVLDLNSLMTAAEDTSSMLCDGLHPNEKGGEFIYTALLAALSEHFPELTCAAPHRPPAPHPPRPTPPPPHTHARRPPRQPPVATCSPPAAICWSWAGPPCGTIRIRRASCLSTHPTTRPSTPRARGRSTTPSHGTVGTVTNTDSRRSVGTPQVRTARPGPMGYSVSLSSK